MSNKFPIHCLQVLLLLLPTVHIISNSVYPLFVLFILVSYFLFIVLCKGSTAIGQPLVTLLQGDSFSNSSH